MRPHQLISGRGVDLNPFQDLLGASVMKISLIIIVMYKTIRKGIRMLKIVPFFLASDTLLASFCIA